MPEANSYLNFQLRSLDGPIVLRAQVVLRLREAINAGHLIPGTRLVERDIAQQLGISRMPVREAIQQLVDEGLAVKEPRRGAYVHPYAAQELEEIYSVRLVLERLVIQRAMARWTPAAQARLEMIADAMIDPAKAGDIHGLFELDNRFHEELWRLAQHTILLEVVSSLRARINRFLIEAAKSLSKVDALAYREMHYRLIAALCSGNLELGEAAMNEHILIAKERITRYYRYLDPQVSA